MPKVLPFNNDQKIAIIGEVYSLVKRIVRVSIFVLTIVCLVACTDAASGGEGADNDPGNETKELIVATGADPTTLDGRKTWSGPGYSMNAHMMEPLVFREIVDNKVNIVGVLAEEFENMDDLNWKFTLREGVTFHNGVPLTSEAVKFTLETILDPELNSPLAQWISDIDEITTDGELIVNIKTKTPTRGLLSGLTQIPIIEPSAVEELGEEFNIKPVGTGPYKIVEYKANSSVELERYDDYWGEAGVSERIKFLIMPENAVRLAALQSGDVHIAENISADKVEEVESDPNLDLYVTETLRVNLLVINFDNPWMEKKEFREALSMAIDRELIVNNILGGNTIPASSASPPGTIGFHDGLPVYEYDIEKAKKLLAEMDYDGSPIKMGAPSGRYAMDRQVNEAIAGMLEDAGINVELETLEFSSFLPKTDERYYDIYYIGLADLTINPPLHWGSYYHSKNSQGGYTNPEVDNLMDQAVETIDDEEAIVLFKELQEIFYEDKPTLPLYYEPHMVGVRKDVQDFLPRLDEYIIVRDAYVEP